MEIITNNPVKNIKKECNKTIVNILKDNISNKEKLIYNLEKEIIKLKNEINQYKKKIYNTCDHNWLPDHSYNNYDRTPYICNLCGLSR